jgi:hypothetical protein
MRHKRRYLAFGPPVSVTGRRAGITLRELDSRSHWPRAIPEALTRAHAQARLRGGGLIGASPGFRASSLAAMRALCAATEA